MNSLYIAWNMCKRTIGNAKSLILLVLVPVIVISAVIGIFGSSPPKNVKIAYVNEDQGTLSQHIITGLTVSAQYELIPVTTVDEAKEKVIAKDVNASFIIPALLSESLETENDVKMSETNISRKLSSSSSSGDVKITIYQLNQDVDTVSLKIALDREIKRVKNAVQAVQEYTRSTDPSSEAEHALLVEQLLLQQEKHVVHTDIMEQKNNNSPFFTTIIGSMLLFVMTLVNSSVHTVVEDRVHRTMARIHTAPVRSFEIALGNFLGSFMIGTVQIVLILLFTTYVLQFQYGLPLLSLFIILECFMLSAIGIASAVAGLVKNMNNLRNVNQLVVIPTCMIGGCFWPIWIMPDFMQKLANFTPQKWTIEAIERMSYGESLFDMGWHIGILLLFSIILLAFGSYVLKPSETAS